MHTIACMYLRVIANASVEDTLHTDAFVFTFALRQNNRFACTRELRKLENGTLMIERLVILHGAL